jgi:hypothetical protein
MAGGDHRGKRPHGRGCHCDVIPPPTGQSRMDVSPSPASPIFRRVSDPRHCSSGFDCFVEMLNPTCRLIQGSLESGNRVGGHSKLREEVLVRERELSEWESALLARESGVVEGERDLRRACMECDAIHD